MPLRPREMLDNFLGGGSPKGACLTNKGTCLLKVSVRGGCGGLEPCSLRKKFFVLSLGSLRPA